MQSLILSSFVLFVSFVVNIPVHAADTSGVMTPDALRAAGFKPLIDHDSLDAWNVPKTTKTTGSSKTASSTTTAKPAANPSTTNPSGPKNPMAILSSIANGDSPPSRT